ncbi:MAG: N-acyl homoserine lactonase family protein [Alphaproteobacteria bacterium]|nr:N-acyl homoserine lactonase family protein [Alphaproteobacteria bacterium]MBV8411224.1 N-acyl homoserine lactonase family protein [Alphaproteobacteria bacterium]
MSVKLYALTCGHLNGPFDALMEGGEGRIDLPIPSFLIEHPKGRALYDTGMHPELRTNAKGRVSERINSMFGFSGFGPGDDIKSKLEAIDKDPAKVDLIIVSHLHFDHVGGNELVPNATVIVQRPEWEAGMAPESEARFGFYKADFDKGHKVKAVEGEYDVFGDGSVVCLPTYGHTPGHQSLKVRTEKGEIVLTGDACYFCRTLKERRLPVRVFDRELMLASLDRLQALEKGGAELIFGHDPEFWKGVPQAPVPLF